MATLARKPAPRVTLAEIARQVGVSSMVASAVLNGATTTTRVAPTTRARVLAEAARLGYRARQPASPRRFTIGVQLAGTGGDTARQVLTGLRQSMIGTDHDLVLLADHRTDNRWADPQAGLGVDAWLHLRIGGEGSDTWPSLTIAPGAQPDAGCTVVIDRTTLGTDVLADLADRQRVVIADPRGASDWPAIRVIDADGVAEEHLTTWMGGENPATLRALMAGRLPGLVAGQTTLIGTDLPSVRGVCQWLAAYHQDHPHEIMPTVAVVDDGWIDWAAEPLAWPVTWYRPSAEGLGVAAMALVLDRVRGAWPDDQGTQIRVRVPINQQVLRNGVAESELSVADGARWMADLAG